MVIKQDTYYINQDTNLSNVLDLDNKEQSKAFEFRVVLF